MRVLNMGKTTNCVKCGKENHKQYTMYRLPSFDLEDAIESYCGTFMTKPATRSGSVEIDADGPEYRVETLVDETGRVVKWWVDKVR